MFEQENSEIEFLRGEIPSFLTHNLLNALPLNRAFEPIEDSHHANFLHTGLVSRLVELIPNTPEEGVYPYWHLLTNWVRQTPEHIAIMLRLAVMVSASMRHCTSWSNAEIVDQASQTAYTLVFGHWLKTAPQFNLLAYTDLCLFIQHHKRALEWHDKVDAQLRYETSQAEIANRYRNPNFHISPTITPAQLNACGYSAPTLKRFGVLDYFCNSADHPTVYNAHPSNIPCVFYGVNYRRSPPALETPEAQLKWLNLNERTQRILSVQEKSFYPDFNKPPKRGCTIIQSHIIQMTPTRSSDRYT